MRRLIALAVLAAMLLVLAPVADAIPLGARRRSRFGENCQDMFLPGMGQVARICVSVNSNDQNPLFQGDLEALIRVAQADNGVDWRVDWAHLYKNGTVVKTTDGQAWENAQGAHHSTDWQNCQGGPSYRGVGRFKVRKNGEVGSWFKLDSDVVGPFGCDPP